MRDLTKDNPCWGAEFRQFPVPGQVSALGFGKRAVRYKNDLIRQHKNNKVLRRIVWLSKIIETFLRSLRGRVSL